MNKKLTAFLLLCLLALSGCGQTGALYMPADKPQNEQSQP
ncbi:LPS translocon maturation chaperone LptM [Vibrio aerogenes]|nr:lipoprotein [Vibrio aerogenes]